MNALIMSEYEKIFKKGCQGFILKIYRKHWNDN